MNLIAVRNGDVTLPVHEYFPSVRATVREDYTIGDGITDPVPVSVAVGDLDRDGLL